MSLNSTIRTTLNKTVTDTLFADYFRVELATAVILVVLSPLTVAANSLLLSAIYKDPLRCFRTPTTYFIVGLAVSDIVTGLIVEPSFIVKYMAHNIQCGLKARCKPSNVVLVLYRIGGIISTIAISSSFIVVLALSISQFIAITFPHRYKRLVTKNRVVVCVVLSWFYFVCFSVIQFSGIDPYTYLKIDLILHPSLISVLLGIVHTLLYLSFRRHLSRSYTWRRENIYEKGDRSERILKRKSRNKENKNRLSERQFTIVTFYLAGILLLSASTHSIVLYVYFFDENKSSQANVNIHIFLRVSDMMLFIKVALDPFIYAWRLPTYRKALKFTIWANKPCNDQRPKDRLTLFLQEYRKTRLIDSATGPGVTQGTGVSP